MNQLNIPSTITLKKDKVVAHHISDGSELIPGEIQASTPEEISKFLNKSLEEGYVVCSQLGLSQARYFNSSPKYRASIDSTIFAQS